VAHGDKVTRMSRSMRVLASTLPVIAGLLVLFTGVGAQGIRRHRPVPDIPGYVTLKADFHLHSVFSDGEVWPTLHVREAWRDGLDAIALTDHLEYRPHKADIAGGARRAFEVARPEAARLGMLLVPGVEITRPAPGVKSEWPVGSAHFNVLFPTDVDALDTPDLAEALSRAKGQGAFVFWNHPGFMDKPAMWFPHVGALFDAGLFSGIEVVNGDRFYPEALTWAARRQLTPLACSDAHLPMPAHLKSVDRPITLVFARTKDIDGLKEALAARRTLAWLDSQVWGDAALLTALWGASATAEPSSAPAGGDVEVAVRNASAIDLDVRALSLPAWLTLGDAMLVRESTTVLRGRIATDAPIGTHAIDARLRVHNLHAEPATPLAAGLPLTVTVEPGR
jgi:3',5'-nucleoside bisphosphate phosphatase